MEKKWVAIAFFSAILSSMASFANIVHYDDGTLTATMVGVTVAGQALAFCAPNTGTYLIVEELEQRKILAANICKYLGKSTALKIESGGSFWGRACAWFDSRGQVSAISTDMYVQSITCK